MIVSELPSPGVRLGERGTVAIFNTGGLLRVTSFNMAQPSIPHYKLPDAE